MIRLLVSFQCPLRLRSEWSKFLLAAQTVLQYFNNLVNFPIAPRPNPLRFSGVTPLRTNPCILSSEAILYFGFIQIGVAHNTFLAQALTYFRDDSYSI